VRSSPFGQRPHGPGGERGRHFEVPAVPRKLRIRRMAFSPGAVALGRDLGNKSDLTSFYAVRSFKMVTELLLVSD
jgi:hypothetical protein